MYEIAAAASTTRVERREERTCDVLRKRGGGMHVIEPTFSRRIITQGPGDIKMGTQLPEWPQRVRIGA